MEETETVTCKTCGKGYPAIFKEYDQGDDCAANVHGNQVTGHYGSALIDTQTWEFVEGRPQEVKEGVICDPCVRELQDKGAIILKETGVW